MKEERTHGVDQIVARIDRLLSEAHTVYAEEVDSLIREKWRDPERIEHLLDGLLDFCFDPEMVDLYKTVCRYYFDIDPKATVDYITSYRELWDSDDIENSIG